MNNLQKNMYVQKNNLINVSQLIYKYFTLLPDPENQLQMVKFGTSGHRGSSLFCTFNELHILAITQAIVIQRKQKGILGPCYIGKDTHALSEVAFMSIIEVLSANKVDIIIDKSDLYTPSPVIAHTILNYNNNLYNNSLKADGIMITSSHNPPEYGGIKYYSCYGGPANTNSTNIIEKYSNIFLLNNLQGVQRITLQQAWKSGYIHIMDFTQEYIVRLTNIINIQAIRQSGIKIGIAPMGSAGMNCWYRISQFYNLNFTFINEIIDPTFQFVHLDYDGIHRIDCASKSVMLNTLNFSDKFDLIFANDPDCDRYGIISPIGFMNSNDYLVTSINYLFQNRPSWNRKLGVGKTLVSSMMIDKIVKKFNRRLIETPVGFKWFVKGLFDGTLGFAGEESAGANFLNFDATPWSTDKDGIIMCLLAAEMSSITGDFPQESYKKIINNFNLFSYNRFQVSTYHYFTYKNFFNMFILRENMRNELFGDPIIKKIKIIKNIKNMEADGIKLMTCNGWIAFRNSGTEKVCKIYCESYLGDNHRQQIEGEIYKHLQNYSKKIL